MIDLSQLTHLFRGDRSQMREWIGLYLQESPAYFKQLSDGLARGDAQAIASAAHDLQPQAHYLGSARLVRSLADIEQQALNGNTPACRELIEALPPLRAAIEADLRAVLDAR